MSTAPPPAPAAELPRPTLNRDATGWLTVRWFTFFSVVLAGLAMGGKGFAYIGLPPLFISEVTLLLGVGVLLLQPKWREMLGQVPVLLILALMGWTALCTLPYLGEHGILAIRDAMLVGYATTALCVAAVVMSRPQVLGWLLRKYQTFVKVFLVVMPIIWTVSMVGGDAIPTWPWAPDVEILNLKPGDMPVHLGGIAALCILGLFRGKSILWMGLLCLLLGVTGAISRGGLVAFSLAFGIAFLLRPQSRWATRLMLVMAVVITLAALSDLSVQVPGRSREFSARQLLLNVTSIVDSGETTGDLDDTKSWRLDWWKKIFGYTVGGEYFWTGKGYGVNLATEDGFQVYENNSLRSPHNGHLNVLARSGVPGFALWCVVQIAWGYAVINAYLRARQRKDANWAMFFALLLAYWAGLMFNAMVDVYLEGPMGGVWFWAIIGLGIGSVWVFERHPEVLHTETATPREA